MEKGPAYDVNGHVKGRGLFAMRDKDEHNARRRTWAGAFSIEAYVIY